MSKTANQNSSGKNNTNPRTIRYRTRLGVTRHSAHETRHNIGFTRQNFYAVLKKTSMIKYDWNRKTQNEKRGNFFATNSNESKHRESKMLAHKPFYDNFPL